MKSDLALMQDKKRGNSERRSRQGQPSKLKKDIMFKTGDILNQGYLLKQPLGTLKNGRQTLLAIAFIQGNPTT